jgi:hypothetical protein
MHTPPKKANDSAADASSSMSSMHYQQVTEVKKVDNTGQTL